MPEELNRHDGILSHLPDLIAGIKPQRLIKHLRTNESVNVIIFQGFRPNPQSLRNPIVQQRLISELGKSPELLSVLIDLWMIDNKQLYAHIQKTPIADMHDLLSGMVAEHGPCAVRTAFLLDERSELKALAGQVDSVCVPNPSQGIPPERNAVNLAHTDDLVEQNCNLKSRIRELEARVREQERADIGRQREIDQSRAEVEAARRESADNRKLLIRTEKHLDRVRRAKETVGAEKSVIERELRQLRKHIRALEARFEDKSVAAEKGSEAATPDWDSIITALYRHGEYQTVRLLYEAAEKADSSNPNTHMVLEHIYSKLGEASLQTSESLWLSDYYAKHGQIIRAVKFACRALDRTPEDKHVKLRFRQIVKKADPSDRPTSSAMQILIGRLKVSNAVAYRKAQRILKELGREYARSFDSRPELLHPDKIISLNDGDVSLQISINQIVGAVNANDEQIVDALQRLLPALKRSSPELHRSIMRKLRAQDTACLDAIMHGSQPIIVDGSNVAWYGCTEVPRIQAILELRKELRAQGYFPIFIYVDASLRHQIDDSVTLDKMIESGSVIMADSHTDADESIIRHARILGCAVVTNDRMLEWDPNDEIQKLRIELDDFGANVYASL